MENLQFVAPGQRKERRNGNEPPAGNNVNPFNFPVGIKHFLE